MKESGPALALRPQRTKKGSHVRGVPGLTPLQIRVPHLRDRLIVANRGPRQLAGGVSFGGHSRNARTGYPTPPCSFHQSTSTPFTWSHSISNPSARTPSTLMYVPNECASGGH